MGIVDPTNHTMGDYFLLSDFMGCDSVYRHGYANVLMRDEHEKQVEGSGLADRLRSIVRSLDSRVSISYGYISPSLSRKIVRYQSPDKPSYHRWDRGAAADIILHNRKGAPIHTVRHIDLQKRYSRIITYAESPYICIGTRQEEGAKSGYRCALYENRYQGPGNRPRHIKYPLGSSDENSVRREDKLKNVELPHGWVGQGWPSYHGGGRKQYHHTRVSKYTMASDFMFNKFNVANGIKNRLPVKKSEMYRWMLLAKQAGTVYDDICNRLQNEYHMKISITSAYNVNVEPTNWTRRFTMELALLDRLAIDDIQDLLIDHPLIKKFWEVEEPIAKLRIVGHDL